MTTLQGMLAQTIHEDRVREYSSPARAHAAAAREARATAAGTKARTLRSVISHLVGRPASEPAAAASRA